MNSFRFASFRFIEHTIQKKRPSEAFLLPKVALLCNIKIYAYSMPSSVSCGTSYSVSFEPGIA